MLALEHKKRPTDIRGKFIAEQLKLRIDRRGMSVREYIAATDTLGRMTGYAGVCMDRRESGRSTLD